MLWFGCSLTLVWPLLRDQYRCQVRVHRCDQIVLSQVNLPILRISKSALAIANPEPRAVYSFKAVILAKASLPKPLSGLRAYNSLALFHDQLVHALIELG